MEGMGKKWIFSQIARVYSIIYTKRKKTPTIKTLLLSKEFCGLWRVLYMMACFSLLVLYNLMPIVVLIGLEILLIGNLSSETFSLCYIMANGNAAMLSLTLVRDYKYKQGLELSIRFIIIFEHFKSHYYYYIAYHIH